MPKRFLHNLVTHHKHSPAKSDDGKTKLAKSTIYCECNNLVATSPFTNHAESVEVYIPVAYVAHSEKITDTFFSATTFYFELRGPPPAAEA